MEASKRIETSSTTIAPTLRSICKEIMTIFSRPVTD